jgi:uncharacterized protein YegJ (DUF2314 family)
VIGKARVLAVAAFVALAACSGEPADAEAEFARALETARSEAKASLPFFWERFVEPGEGDFDFSLKAALQRRDGQPGVEEAWVESIARAPDRIIGELSAPPRYLGELREGSIVEFQEGQVVDWAFFEGERLLGHYTTRVLLPRLDTTQQEWLRAMLSSDPTGGAE